MSDAQTNAERRLFAVNAALTRKAPAALSEHERVFLDVWSLEAEVNNGGFDQYFLNSSGREAARAANSLRRIGADQCAEIVAEAVGVLSRTELDWSNDGARQEAVLLLSGLDAAKLDALDERFFTYPDDLSALLDAFVAAHPANFG